MLVVGCSAIRNPQPVPQAVIQVALDGLGVEVLKPAAQLKQMKRFPPVGEDNLRCRAGDGGGRRARLAIFHDLVFANKMMAAQGQTAGLPSRCRPQRFVSNPLDFLRPERRILSVNGRAI